MGDRPWHKRFHGDAITGYMGLTLEERGAYTTLLDHMYDRNAALVDNMRLLAGFLDISVRKAEAVIESLLLKGKLYRRDDGKISNRRFEKEVQNLLETSDHMAVIGSAGGRKSAENRKKPLENNGGRQRTLKPGSSYPEPESEPDSKKKKPKAEAAPKAPPGLGLEFQYPTWWPQKAWADFLEMRKRKRAPVTVRARELIIGDLTKWRAMGHDPAVILDQSTRKSWTDVYEPGAKPGQPAPTAREDEVNDALWTQRLEAFYHGSEEWEVAAGYWQAKWGAPPPDPACKATPESRKEYHRLHPARIVK